MTLDFEKPIIRRRGRVFLHVGTTVFWQAVGCSWKGRTTKRDGKVVHCGHKHKTEKAADVCAHNMRRTKPGKCQWYKAVEIHMVKYKAVP